MKPAVIHSEARAELDAAIFFYESRAKGLGLALQRKVQHAVVAIQKNPESGLLGVPPRILPVADVSRRTLCIEKHLTMKQCPAGRDTSRLGSACLWRAVLGVPPRTRLL